MQRSSDWIRTRAGWLVAGFVLLAGGCGGDGSGGSSASARGDGGRPPLDAQAATIAGAPAPGSVAATRAAAGVPRLTPGSGPFYARGRIALRGAAPFAHPVLVIAGGATYQLAGPLRAQCLRRRGKLVEVRGTVQHAGAPRGLRGVVTVSEVREVRP